MLQDLASELLKTDTLSFYILIALVSGIAARFTVNRILSKKEIDHIARKAVFITGCDSGFGKLLARSLDAKCVRVFAGCLTEKGASDLTNESSSRLKTVVVNIAKKEQVERAYGFVKSHIENEGLWGLVNNAGIMPTYCPAEWATFESFEETCQVNLLGTVSVTLKFLPLLRMGGGRLVCVCSATSDCPYPGVANYSVSKAAVKTFSICLRRELLNSGVTVHTIEPGGYNTGITSERRLTDCFVQAYRQATPEAQAFYGGRIARYLMDGLKITHKFVNFRLEDVTDAMTHALFARYPKRSYPVGLDTKLFFRVMGLVPDRVADFIIGWPRPYGNTITEFKTLQPGIQNG